MFINAMKLFSDDLALNPLADFHIVFISHRIQSVVERSEKIHSLAFAGG